jgi:hypothetical protein
VSGATFDQLNNPHHHQAKYFCFSLGLERVWVKGVGLWVRLTLLDATFVGFLMNSSYLIRDDVRYELDAESEVCFGFHHEKQPGK